MVARRVYSAATDRSDYRGIETAAGGKNLAIESNAFQGGAYGVFVLGGNNVQVTRNSFDGFSILGNGDGGVAILDIGGSSRATGNSIQYNQVTSSVPPGDYWLFLIRDGTCR